MGFGVEGLGLWAEGVGGTPEVRYGSAASSARSSRSAPAEVGFILFGSRFEFWV